MGVSFVFRRDTRMDETPTPTMLAGPLPHVVAGLLCPRRQDIELILHIGWETTLDGLLLPIPLTGAHHD